MLFCYYAVKLLCCYVIFCLVIRLFFNFILLLHSFLNILLFCYYVILLLCYYHCYLFSFRVHEHDDGLTRWSETKTSKTKQNKKQNKKCKKITKKFAFKLKFAFHSYLPKRRNIFLNNTYEKLFLFLLWKSWRIVLGNNNNKRFLLILNGISFKSI